MGILKIIFLHVWDGVAGKSANKLLVNQIVKIPTTTGIVLHVMSPMISFRIFAKKDNFQSIDLHYTSLHPIPYNIKIG